MRKLSYIFILIITIMISGCGVNETKAFRKTSDLYYEYINTPAELKMKESKITKEGQQLVAQMMPIDLALNQFVRDFSRFNSVPSPYEIQSFVRNYSWLSSVVLTNAEGQVISQEPSYLMKNLDFSVIAGKESVLGERQMFAVVLDSDLGPEIALCTPLYNKGTLIGYIIANFAPSALANLSPNPNNLIISFQDKILWTSQPELLAGTNYLKESANSLHGKMNANGQNIQWQIFYLADLPLAIANIYSE